MRSEPERVREARGLRLPVHLGRGLFLAATLAFAAGASAQQHRSGSAGGGYRGSEQPRQSAPQGGYRQQAAPQGAYRQPSPYAQPSFRQPAPQGYGRGVPQTGYPTQRYGAQPYGAQPYGYRQAAPPGYAAPQGYAGQPAGYGAPQGYRSAPGQGQGMRTPAPIGGYQNAAPIERRVPGGNLQTGAQITAAPPLRPGAEAGANFSTRGGHLTEWMGAHQNLSPQQQQEALGREPGFRQLPRETQERFRERLSQLDAMPPAERQRMLNNTEAMERLNPAQRAEVRGAMSQLGGLPPQQRGEVSRAFRDLRGLPQQERLNILNSRYRNLDPQSRATLEQLMAVEPMLPAGER